MFRKARKFLGGLLLSATLPVAHAAVIDFEVLAHNDAETHFHGSVYEEDGYRLIGGGVTGFASFGTLEARFSGSTALFPFFAGISLEKADGGAFSLKSIDLAELNGPTASVVTFIGFRADGTDTTQVFTLDGVPFAPETFVFDSSFSNLVEVFWGFETGDPVVHQFDNIVVKDAVSVPEPGTAATLGLGLLGFAAARRRRQ
jgi:hypothetical protein